MRKVTAALIGALLTGAALQATAVPLAYDEFVSGDLGFGTVTVLPMDIGVNTIKGSMALLTLVDAQGNRTFADDLDPVALTIPQGMALYGVSLETHFTDTTQNTKSAMMEWFLQGRTDASNVYQKHSCYAFIAGLGCPLSPNGGPLFGGYPLSTSSDFFISQAASWVWHEFSASTGGTFAYTLTFNVAAVPESASVDMMLGGLVFGGLLGVLRKRRRSGQLGHVAARIDASI